MNSKLGVKPEDVITDWAKNVIKIKPNTNLKKAKNEIYFALQLLKQKILGVIVKGYSKIKRAVVHLYDDNRGYYLMAEGTGLIDILTTPGVEWKKSYTNSVLEMNDVLGIEASRQSIINEIQFILKSQDINIDSRHLSILADRMACQG